MAHADNKIKNGITSIDMIRKEMRIHGRSFIPSAHAIKELLDRKGIKPLSSQGWKQYYYNKSNVSNCINRNIGELIDIENDLNNAKELTKHNSIDKPIIKQDIKFTPRKHGESNVSLELLRQDESIGRSIVISESQYRRLFNEDVFINNADKKRKKANLTYVKHATDKERVRNTGNINSFDMLNTYKMDNDSSSDTYEYPLKGGLTSYNITSIRGEEVMHYFKRHFDKLKTVINIKDEEGVEAYELVMQDKEFSDFINQFSSKVSTVIRHAMDTFDNGDVKFSGISILPVYSSSRFNVEMAKIMAATNKLGLPTQVINENMFKKDLSDIRKDEEFINKNKDYYNSQLYDSGGKETHMNNVDSSLSKLKALNTIKQLITQYNQCVQRMLINGYYQKDKSNPKTVERNIMNEYYNMVNIYNQIQNALKYTNLYGTTSKMNAKGVVEPKKYTKGPSVDKRTEWLWNNIIKRNVRGKAMPKIPVRELNDSDFQIKTLTNDVRMALRGYFKPQEDVVQQELDKIKGTIFVVFDDNISGGATLSDICLQAKELGIEYIVPITFGQMSTKYNYSNTLMVTKPTANGQFKQY